MTELGLGSKHLFLAVANSFAESEFGPRGAGNHGGTKKQTQGKEEIAQARKQDQLTLSSCTGRHFRYHGERKRSGIRGGNIDTPRKKKLLYYTTGL